MHLFDRRQQATVFCLYICRYKFSSFLSSCLKQQSRTSPLREKFREENRHCFRDFQIKFISLKVYSSTARHRAIPLLLKKNNNNKMKQSMHFFYIFLFKLVFKYKANNPCQWLKLCLSASWSGKTNQILKPCFKKEIKY